MSLFEKLNERENQVRNEFVAEEKGLGDIVSDLSTVFGYGAPSKMKASEYLKAAKGWIYACVSVISDEIATIPLKLCRIKKDGSKEEVYDHPALDIIYKVNNFTTKEDHIKNTFQYLELTGEAPWYLSFSGGVIKNILLLRPDHLTVIPGSSNDEVIKGYKYKVFNGSGYKEITLEPEEVVFFKYPDPDSQFRGKGPLQAAAETVDLDNDSESYNRAFFRNSAQPGAVLESEKPLSQEVRDRLQKRLKERYGGLDNSHKTMVLEGGLKFKPTSLSQKDMDFVEQQRFSRDKIFAIFRVPRTVLGITDDVNRANAEATDYVFAKRTIKPKITFFVAQLNEFFLPLFDDSGTLYFEFDDPVPENVDQKLKIAEGVGKGWLTVNEARELFGYDPVVEGDTIREPFQFNPIANMLSVGKKKSKDIPYRAKILSTRSVNNKKKEEKKKEVIKKVVSESLIPIIYSALKLKYKNQSKLEKLKQQKLFTGTDEEKLATKQMFQRSQLKIADAQEKKIQAKLIRIMKSQNKEIQEKLNAKKYFTVKKLKANDFILDEKEQTAITVKAMEPTVLEVIATQSKLAFQLLGIQDQLSRRNEAVAEYMEKRVFKFSHEVTQETNRLLSETLAEGIREEESISALKKRVASLFDNMEDYRATRIARTETIRSTNFATEEAYIQSGVVEGKEWLATIDERTDEDCLAMDGKVIGLGENYFDKGDHFHGHTFDYEDITYPPLHTNCRCTLIPVVSR